MSRTDNSWNEPPKKKQLSNQERKRQYVDQNWNSVGVERDATLLRSKDNQEGHLSTYRLNNRYDPSDEVAIYQKRKRTKDPLIRVLESQYRNEGSGLVPINSFKVVTERIPHRLTDAPQLTYPESLYILNESLRGHQVLYNKVGSYHVNSDMFGFDPQGHTRVWYNQNFGINHPSAERRYLQSTIQDNYYFDKEYHRKAPRDEVELVRNIVQVVEDKNEEGRFPDSFGRKILNYDVGFKEALSIVEDQYRSGRVTRVDHVDLTRNMILGKRTTTTVKTATSIPPQQHYLFNYIPPKSAYHPTIFASRAKIHEDPRY